MVNLLSPVLIVGPLIGSNVFLTFAWHGHFRFKGAAPITVILISWGIAFLEYLLQVPAKRIGSSYSKAAQLKSKQEIITLVIFAIF